jgi:Cu/Ag efflux protein CusF
LINYHLSIKHLHRQALAVNRFGGLSMKKIHIAAVLFLCAMQAVSYADTSRQKTFQASGEVTGVSPMSSRISIKHDAIKGFSGAETTEFFVTSKSLVSHVATGDLVDFQIADNQGDVRIDKITRTGVAAPKENSPLGRTVQGALESAGDAVNDVTKPIQPVNEIANSAMGATTKTTGGVLRDADTENKQQF